MERRKRRVKAAKKQDSSIFSKIVAFVVVLIILFTVSVLIKLSSLKPYTYLSKGADGMAVVRRVDTQNDKLHEVSFPANTELELAYNLGTYQIKNAWILGTKEGYDGDLVAKSILKNHYIPVYLWDDGESNNLSLLQRIKNILIEKNIGRMDKDEYTVGESAIPYYVYLNFSLPTLRDSVARVEVEDGTNSGGLLPFISSVVEVVGGKVINNAKVRESDIDCVVSGEDDLVVTEIADVFNCAKRLDSEQESDVKIIIGTKFAERF